MRISELIDREVVDEQGHRVGKIHDIRLVQDAPGTQDGPAMFRVDAVVVGRWGVAVRLGYEPGGVRGPWLVKWLLTTFIRSPEEIPWAALRPTDDGRFVR